MLEQFTKVKPAAAMALLIPGPVWKKHNLAHPLGESFEGFPDIIPNEVPPSALADAERLVTPELLNEGVCAGTVDEIVDEVKPLVAAGMRHLVMWNVGPIATGGGAADIVRQTQLIWRLKKLQTNGA
jgi:phthiodiolone/phenolphthiodiolone dimycocerosates ketoreductase